MKRRGFTLVEVMVVLLIIGMLAMIAIPGWMKVRETSRGHSCRENRRVIDSAKQQWALDKNKADNETPAQAELVPEFIKSQPLCPENGAYTIGAVWEGSSCSIHGSD